MCRAAPTRVGPCGTGRGRPDAAPARVRGGARRPGLVPVTPLSSGAASGGQPAGWGKPAGSSRSTRSSATRRIPRAQLTVGSTAPLAGLHPAGAGHGRLLGLEGVPVAAIDLFRMERMQSLYWHLVDYDLSESGVSPMSIAEMLEGTELGDPATFAADQARLSAVGGLRAHPRAHRGVVSGRDADNVTVVNGGSEANFLTLLTLLGRGDRLAFEVPNYLEGRGLGRLFGEGTDTFRLKLRGGRWGLDVDELERAVGTRTKVIMVCNPNNPTGAVLSRGGDGRGRGGGRAAGAWIVADEIYRGTEVEGDDPSPSFWGR